jgi:protein-S-isoprenylcysteine O-methyltransferase Ste14
MYLGYFLSQLGYLLSSPTVWNTCIYLCVWLLLIARVHAEERILREDDEYREYMSRVRFRIVPGLY